MAYKNQQVGIKYNIMPKIWVLENITICTTCKLTGVLKFGRTTTVCTPDPGNPENIPWIMNNYIP